MRPQVQDGPARHNQPHVTGRESAPTAMGNDASPDLADAVLDVAAESEPLEALRLTVEKAMSLTGARYATLGAPSPHSLQTSSLDAPITDGAIFHAHLIVTDKAEGARFTARDETSLNALTRAAGIALKHARERDDARLLRERLEIVVNAARGLLSGASIGDVLERLADQVRGLADADLVTITLPDDDGVHQIIETAVGFRADLVRGMLTVRDGSVAGEVLRTGRARVFGDTRRSAEPQTNAVTVTAESAGPVSVAASRYAELGVGPALVLPMTADGEVRGVLAACRRAGREPFEAAVHEAVAELGHEAAALIVLADHRLDEERVQLYQDRERIARDLHDLVVQRLFGVCMTLAGVRDLSQRADVAARVGQSIDELDDTIRQIRSTIFALQAQRPASADSPLRHRIIQEVDAARQVLGFPAALRMEGLIDTDVPPAVAEHVIAVLREALANVARHARARRVEVDVVVDDRVVIAIADDGLGPPDSVHRSGLDNLAHRAEQLAGEFTVEAVHPHYTGPGTGTRIRWQVPLQRSRVR